MKLKRDGLLMRWTYAPTREKWDFPDQVSLCRFFWRAFLLMPLFWVILGLVSPVIGIVYLCTRPKVRIWQRNADTRLEQWGDVLYNGFTSVKESVFIQGLKTLKGKV